MTVPRTLHLLMHEHGGGTETNVRRLCDTVPEFEMMALETIMGFPPNNSRLPAVLRAVRAYRPEVVFCYGLHAHLAACLAWPLGGPALVGNIRGVVDFAGRKAIVRRLIRWRFSKWVSNSRHALYGEPGVVIPNGVELPDSNETALFNDLPKPVFGVLASGHAVKGHDFFLDVWHKLDKPGTLIFAGRLGKNLQEKAEAEGVICPGFVPAGPLLRSLDLLVIPSISEGMPTVLLEAMIRGIPCLATPVGGIPEVIEHGKTGLLIPREQSSWISGIRELDWKALPALGEAARQVARKNYLFSQMRDAFVRVASDARR